MPAAGADVDELARRVRAGERRALARAITLVESRQSEDEPAADRLLDLLAPVTGAAMRLAVTGPPGVGKSSFIEALGVHLVAQGRRLAVLAVDPSSPVTGGSILGDKTRMQRLGNEPLAYVRPSPSAGTRGGVAPRTRESMLVCEAGGHDVVLIETVGVGQSEIDVAGMVDLLVLLLQPGAGDGLQGMKRGVLELGDVVLVTKADGALRERALATQRDFEAALGLMRGCAAPPVLTLSSVSGEGIEEAWAGIEGLYGVLRTSGELERRRRTQELAWYRALVAERVMARLLTRAGVAALAQTMDASVAAGRLAARRAARALLEALDEGSDADSRRPRHGH